MQYAGLKKNDIVDCEDGICVSFWTQGCPHRCPGCYNLQTWDFSGGLEAPTDLKSQIIEAIGANGIQRNFSVLGGEPLCKENITFVDQIIASVRMVYPDIKIYVWTGSTLDDLLKDESLQPHLNFILENIDVLVDGRFEQEKRDITLPLRGSSNQRILRKGIDF